MTPTRQEMLLHPGDCNFTYSSSESNNDDDNDDNERRYSHRSRIAGQARETFVSPSLAGFATLNEPCHAGVRIYDTALKLVPRMRRCGGEPPTATATVGL